MTNSTSCDSLSGANQSDLLPLAEGSVDAGAAIAVAAPSAWRDFLGITASIACAIHCAAMPFVIGFLPALGLSFLADEAFHKWMAGACFVIALVSFVPGWRRHGRFLPAAVATAGITIITATAFGLSDECCAACEAGSTTANASEDAACCERCVTGESDSTTTTTTDQTAPATALHQTASIMPAFITEYAAWWTPLGGVLLIGAHLLNRRFVTTCTCCDHG